MPEKFIRGQGGSVAGDILGLAAWSYRRTKGAHMVCSYLNHAAVYRQGRANHVDVGRGSGALPLGETSACGWVGRGVVEGMRGGISVGWAAGGLNKDQNSRLSSNCLPRSGGPPASTWHTEPTFIRKTDAEFCHFFKTGPWVWPLWLTQGLSGFICHFLSL